MKRQDIYTAKCLRNRVIALLIAITLAAAAIIGRLFYLQIIEGETLAAKAASQRLIEVEVEHGRGQIYDRNMIPLVNRSTTAKAVIQPRKLNGDPAAIERIARLLPVESDTLKNDIRNQVGAVVVDITPQQEKMLESSDIKGVSLVYATARYDSNTLARHVIGYINKADKKGQMGIEKQFDDILRDRGRKVIAVISDAANRPIDGLGYRVIDTSREDALDVKLTIDYHIQKAVEKAMDEKNIKGAIVVEDVKTGDILAMASKPDYDQSNVDMYLESSNNELFNRCVAGYDLGSVFKIITAAALIENNQLGRFENYLCTGYTVIDGRIFRCSSANAGGHGMVNMSEAFARSCNPAFIHLGLKIGPKPIIDMAKKLGLGAKTGLYAQGIDESAGNLPDSEYYSRQEIANISIGQGSILVTPVQVVNLIATIANDGVYNQINIVEGLVDSDGKVVRPLRNRKSTRVISSGTAAELRSMMEEVTLAGTGSKAAIPAEFGGSAGKTGSAETGMIEDGERVVQAWFAGYFPSKNPRYAMAVFVENGKTGSEVAAPLFYEIAMKMIEMGY